MFITQQQNEHRQTYRLLGYLPRAPSDLDSSAIKFPEKAVGGCLIGVAHNKFVGS
jgi:hypothetical protein